MDAPFLQAFKARLDVALGSLVCWLAALHIAGGWNEMSIVVLFNPGHSMILCIRRGEKNKTNKQRMQASSMNTGKLE